MITREYNFQSYNNINENFSVLKTLAAVNLNCDLRKFHRKAINQ